MTVRDCCAVIYDKPQYWYKYWTQHITNREEIKDQCFYPGTKMIYEPFEIDVRDRRYSARSTPRFALNSLVRLSFKIFPEEVNTRSLVAQLTEIHKFKVSFQLFKFDRIAWLQTPFGMTIRDMCPVLFDEPQYWYKYWTKYITNKDDFKGKCPDQGKNLFYEPFSLNLFIELTGLPLNGRYKVVMTAKAFSPNNEERETSICVEVEGQFERLN
ncbi:uncharacterized protein LOC6577150 [Drosophila mojavensis]|uniref:uncharacterized protein LOC6577150 n=1 Tax=Drosophila mojavensis TaxID=7230 RepID=UPI001CD09775|nr:uncharacterized protein LOC6577150 [Drosophila mojavensis]